MNDVETENISAYWKTFFGQHPKLLRNRSNEEAKAQWLKDHPGQDKVPPSVMNGLTNVKSILRGKRGGTGKRGRPRKEPVADRAAPAVKSAKAPAKVLEAVEDGIDRCLALIGHQDQAALGKVVQLLKQARRATIFQMGE